MTQTTEAVAPKPNGKTPQSQPVRMLPLADIVESPTNPRKTFTEIEDLAKSIMLHGILEPVLVRPKGERFEIVFGARRFRASKLAKLGSMPVMVRELGDLEALELQLVENSKRVDVHPLEESDAYEQLHKKHGLSVEEIAAKVGKSTAAIYARMKLCALVPDGRKAFFSGKLTPALALLVARIPDVELQKKALTELERDSYGGEPVSLREARDLIVHHFMLRIVDAPFDTADAKLTAAGACSSCPKRTGNQRELFSDIDKKDDLCTDPKCFGDKRGAAYQVAVELAKKTGQRVLSDAESKKAIAYGSDYLDLDAKNWGAGGKTNRSLLKKLDPGLIVIAKGNDGELRQLVRKSDAKPFLKTSGTKLEPSTHNRDADKKRREAEKKARDKARAELEQLVAKAEKKKPNDAFWRVLARAIARAMWHDTHKEVCARRELAVAKTAKGVWRSAYEEAIGKAIAAMKGSEARGLCVELVACSVRGDSNKTRKEFLAALGKR